MSPFEFDGYFASQLAKNFNLRLQQVEFPNPAIPHFALLDRTRNIHSYFVLCKVEDGILESLNWQENSVDNMLLMIIKAQYSELDRPLFIVIEDTDGIVKIVEGNEIREEILTNGTRNINKFIINEALPLNQVIYNITKEL